jgi:hypothetical protein
MGGNARYHGPAAFRVDYSVLKGDEAMTWLRSYVWPAACLALGGALDLMQSLAVLAVVAAVWILALAALVAVASALL